jgi:hypothetical protein
MIFARKSDADLASLVKQLDALLVQHANQKLASFVNFIGPDSEALQAEAKKFGREHEVKHVALVVPIDHEHGPPGFQISPATATTVMIYRDATVAATHGLAADGLTKAKIRQILTDASKVLD